MAIDPKTGLPIPDGFAGSKAEIARNRKQWDLAHPKTKQEALNEYAAMGRKEQLQPLNPTVQQPKTTFRNEAANQPGVVSANAGRETVTLGATGTPPKPTGPKVPKPLGKTGAITPEGAENPYTGGVEVASPSGKLYGVNRGIYSPENKQKAWEAAGGTGTYNTDAFFRDPTTGEMKMKPGYVKPAGTTGAPATGTGAPGAPGAPGVPTGAGAPATGTTGAPTTGAPAGTGAPATGAPTGAGAPAVPGLPGEEQFRDETERLREEKRKKIDETYKSYALQVGNLQENAGYYRNWNDINTRFNNIIADIKNKMMAGEKTFLTDAEYKEIADKYGIGPDQVKNPLSIYNALELTDAGKDKLGVTKAEQGIEAMQTAYARQKADAQTAISRTTEAVNNQIDDATTQLNRNLDFMTAQGAWTGAARSTAYAQ